MASFLSPPRRPTGGIGRPRATIVATPHAGHSKGNSPSTLAIGFAEAFRQVAEAASPYFTRSLNTLRTLSTFGAATARQ